MPGAEALLTTLTQVLSAGDPFSDDAGRTPISEVLNRAEQRYLHETAADPEFQARVLLQLATIRISLREYEQALTLLERAQELARDHPLDPARQAELTLTHSRALAERGQLTEADRLLVDSDLLVPIDEAGPAQLAALLFHSQIRNEQGEHAAHAGMLPQFAVRLGELKAPPPTLRHDITSAYARLLVDQGKPDDAQRQFDQAQLALDDLDRPYERQVRLHFARAVAHAMSHRLDEAEREYKKALALADARVGPNHPVRLVLLTNYGSLLLRQRLYEEAYQPLAPLESQATQLENPRQRASLYDGIAVSALQTGRSEAAIATTLLRLRTMIEIEPRQRADIRPDYAAQTAWFLFEVGDNGLAKAYAEHAAPGETPGDGAKLVSMITSELLGKSSPFTIGDLNRTCTQAQYRTFRAALVDGQLKSEGDIPGDCNPQTTARLQAMGLTPGPGMDTRLIDRVSFDSPLLQRILKNAPVVPLDPDTRRDFLDLLKRFEADQEKASSIKLPPTPSAVP
ncbi:MAG: tetratricopeptide repeat protein [Ahniella sp.]|nr:tetratricopeptide repeat protein [Ahniella sp.]